MINGFEELEEDGDDHMNSNTQKTSVLPELSLKVTTSFDPSLVTSSISSSTTHPPSS